MKKTLADFKRDISIGDNIYCEKIEEAMLMGNFNDENARWGELHDAERKNGMLKMRTVTYKDTTGFYLGTLEQREQGKKGSYCEFPKASGLQYDGETFIISVSDKRGVWQRRTYKIID